jgi:transcriptional regulator with XRE-family HTH domain
MLRSSRNTGSNRGLNRRPKIGPQLRLGDFPVGDPINRSRSLGGDRNLPIEKLAHILLRAAEPLSEVNLATTNEGDRTRDEGVRVVAHNPLTKPAIGLRQHPAKGNQFYPFAGIICSMGTVGENVRRLREAAGLSQDQLAEAAKTTQSTIDRIERDEVQNSRFLPRIAGVLRVGIAELDESYGEAGPPALPPVAQPISADRDFPIYTAAEGGPGEIIRSPDPVDWWPRPIEVLKVRGAYGMYIVGDSMIPEFEPGQVAVINPNLPFVASKPYIFYAEKAGESRATVKRLRRATPDAWHVLQHNPQREFTLSRNLWTIAHRVVGRQDPS